MNSQRLYIYFRVKSESEAAVVAAVRELQQAWQSATPGLRCELQRRVDRHGDVTLMETYAHSAGVGVALRKRIEREGQARLEPWLVGERHTEVFEPCA